jgi:hypothetical protein
LTVIKEKKQKQKHDSSQTSKADAKEPKKLEKAKKTAEPPKLTTLVMQELPKPRVQHLFVGGSFLNPGEVVSPGVPAVLNSFPGDQLPNRLGLAKWLVDPANPLTARVAVNRIWAQYFGSGIVLTIEDFGTKGERPTHPELLDWLATEFIRRHWDLKSMHRLIVTSATYRQSSRATPELLELHKITSKGVMLANAIRKTVCSPAGQGCGSRPNSFAIKRWPRAGS